MKLLRFEFKKIFTARIFIMLFIALVAEFALLFVPSFRAPGYSPEIYRRYLTTLGGEFSEEKYEYIKSRYDDIAGIISVHEDTVSAYQNGQITLEEFEEHNRAYTKAMSEEQTVGFLMKKSDYFKTLSGDCVYFYDTDWDEFLGNMGFDIVTAFAVIFIVIPVFCSEFSSNTRSVLFSAEKGTTQLCITKIIAAFITAFVVAMLLLSMKYLFFCIIHGDFGSWKIRNIMDYSAYGNLSICGFYFIDSLIKTSVWAVCAIFICAVSCLTQSSLFTMFFTAAALSPAIIPVLSEGNFCYIFLGAELSNGYFADLNIYLISAILLVKSIIYLIAVRQLWIRLK